MLMHGRKFCLLVMLMYKLYTVLTDSNTQFCNQKGHMKSAATHMFCRDACKSGGMRLVTISEAAGTGFHELKQGESSHLCCSQSPGRWSSHASAPTCPLRQLQASAWAD